MIRKPFNFFIRIAHFYEWPRWYWANSNVIVGYVWTRSKRTVIGNDITKILFFVDSRGECDAPGPHSRVFGGQVLAQALKAAYETIPDGFVCNSFHCYFIRGGEERTPIIYEVKRIRNGRNFAIRTVEAIQHGKVIHSSEFSFQREGSASNFTVTPRFPNVPAPESLKNGMVIRNEMIEEGHDPKKLRAFKTDRIAPSCEIRPCDEEIYLKGSDGRVLKQYIWMRYNDPIGR